MSATEHVRLTRAVEDRGAELEGLGFKKFDALHVASAEVGGAECLLTTDEALLRLARRKSSNIRIRVVNPLQWISEVFGE